MNRRSVPWIVRLVLIASCALAAPMAIVRAAPMAACADPAMPEDLVPAVVVTVVDGDTVRVRAAGRIELVRVIGIDAPETRNLPHMDRQARTWSRARETIRAMGEEATKFAARHLDRRDVGLGMDVQKRDRNGRLLAYVWLPDGSMFNRLIVEEGYAAASPFPPNLRYAEVFRACEAQARIAGRGLWRVR